MAGGGGGRDKVNEGEKEEEEIVRIIIIWVVLHLAFGHQIHSEPIENRSASNAWRRGPVAICVTAKYFLQLF